MTRRAKIHGSTAKEAFSSGEFLEKGTFLFLYTVSVGYGISARSLDEYITYALTIAGITVFLLTALEWSTRRKNVIAQGRRLAPLTFKYLMEVLAVNTFVSLLIGLFYYSLAVSVVDFYDWFLRLNPMGNQRQFIGVGAAIIFALGCAFFWIRLKLRFTYGVIEATVGVALAVHRLSAEQQIGLPADTGFYFAMLTASVYLIVRGLDNMHQGWKDVAKDPLATFLFYLGSKPIYPKTHRRLRPRDVYAENPKRKRKINRIVEKPSKM